MANAEIGDNAIASTLATTNFFQIDILHSYKFSRCVVPEGFEAAQWIPNNGLIPTRRFESDFVMQNAKLQLCKDPQATSARAGALSVSRESLSILLPSETKRGWSVN
jgi:hypothetical protein